MNDLNFGLVGCGRIGERHAEILTKLKGARLIAVCDPKKEQADNFSKKYNTKTYYDYRELLKDSDVDIISVCTPTGLHAKIVIDGAKASKHIITEKPMALNSADAKNMIKECEKANVKLFVVKQNRYNPPVMKAYEALKKGRFGKLVLLNTTVRWSRPQEYYDQDSWRGTLAMDGGVFMNQASHHIDLLRWFGGPVNSVFAKIDTFTHKIEVEDTGVAILKFQNGALGIIEATTCVYPKNLEGSLTIIGEKGTAKIGGFAVNKIDVWDFKNYENEDELITKSSVVPPDIGFSHREFFKNVIGSIKTNKDPLLDGIEGLKTLELIEAIYESARTGKEVKLKNI